MTVSRVRLKVGPLRPLVPSIDEDKRLVYLAPQRGLNDDLAQPILVTLRTRTHQDVRLNPTTCRVVPRGHDTSEPLVLGKVKAELMSRDLNVILEVAFK